MNDKSGRTYKSWLDGGFKSEQREYTEPTRLLTDNGTLLSPGWARHMVFDYRPSYVSPRSRLKEWEFYQVSNGRYTVQVNLAKIAVGGFVSAVLIDLRNPNKTKRLCSGEIVNSTVAFLGNKKIDLPVNGEMASVMKYRVTGIGKAEFEIRIDRDRRILRYKSKAQGKDISCEFEMKIPHGHESLVTVLPFRDKPKCFFMTMKQNCMPCSGSLTWGDDAYHFFEDETFCCLDWGRVNAPHRIVWYWGNCSCRVEDSAGDKHTFGFEITWGIGDESTATETCLFYDGRVHKIGAVDVEVFPKDKYMQPWHIVSQDGRLDMTMTPFYDHHSDMNLIALRMNCHQVHGTWNGTAVLDDGTKLEIHDAYAFCEYVENRW